MSSTAISAHPGLLVEITGLIHAYGSGRERVVALPGLDFVLAPREMVAIVGPSGCGKTTLMNILAGLERPSSGRVRVAGRDLTRMTRRELLGHRRRMVGYVWQRPRVGLWPSLTVLENVQVPMLGGPGGRHERRARAVRLLMTLGLSDRLDRRLEQLSAAETQRLALAVALANRPPLLLVDEPAAGLDAASLGELLADLRSLLGQLRTAALMVSHHPELGRYLDRVVPIQEACPAFASPQAPHHLRAAERAPVAIPALLPGSADR
jgi:putative ABC transport system ATP-binding protein